MVVDDVGYSSPSEEWEPLFLAPVRLPFLARTRVMSALRGTTAQWRAIVGTPGMGRSTVVRQYLSGVDGPFVLVDAAGPASMGLREIIDRARAERRAEPGTALLIAVDDADVLLRDTADIDALLAGEQDVQLITVTAERIEDILGRRPSVPFLQLDAWTLNFSPTELVVLVRAALGGHRDTDAIAAEIHDRWGGHPLATAVALDRMRAGEGTGDPAVIIDFRVVLHAVVERIRAVAPPAAAGPGFLASASRLSLLPRFTASEAQAILGAERSGDFDRLRRSTFNAERLRDGRTGTASFTWAADGWAAIDGLREHRREERADLAARLRDLGLPIAELAQRILLEDWARVEELLGARFRHSYLSLDPVVAGRFLRVPPATLADYPLSHAFRALLGQRQRGRGAARVLRESAELLDADEAVAPHILLTRIAVRAQLLHILGERNAAKEAVVRTTRMLTLFPADAQGETVIDVTLLAAGLQILQGGVIEALELLESCTVEGPSELEGARESARRSLARLALREVEADDTLFAQPRAPWPQRPLGVTDEEYRIVRWVAQSLDEGKEDLVADFGAQLLAAHKHEKRSEGRTFEVAILALAVTLADRPRQARALVDGLAVVRKGAAMAFADAQALVMLGLGNAADARKILESGQLTAGFSTVAVAMLRLSLGDPSAALEALARHSAHTISPRSLAASAAVRAQALLHLRRGEEAVEELQRALRRYGGVALGYGLRFVSSRDIHLLGRRLAGAEQEQELARVVALATERPHPFPDRAVEVSLTRREREVLSGLLAGLTPDQIATAQFVSINTVRSQLASLRRKFEARDTKDLTLRARRLDLLD